MINALAIAIALLLSSLAASSVLSPHTATTPPPSAPPDGLLREGHRLIVVEYERVLPQHPGPQPSPPHAASILQDAGDRLHEAASSVLPEEQPAVHRVCDAFGVCKDKVKGLFARSREGAEHAKEAAGEAKQKAEHAAVGVRETVERAVEGARERVEHAADEVREKAGRVAEEARERAGRAAEEVRGNASRAAGEARREVAEILRWVKEAAAHVVGNAGWAVAHMAAWATAYGACVWMTFASSHVLAGALGRQQLAAVQSRVYPVYFRVVAYSLGAALLSYYFGVGRRQGPAERRQTYNFLAGLGTVLANMLFVEPRATKVMFESMKLEKEEGRGSRDMADIMAEPATAAAPEITPTAFVTRRVAATDQETLRSTLAKLHAKLKTLNSYSSLLNILTLMSLSWHLVHLAGRLACC